MAGRKPPQSIMNVLSSASQEHGIPFNVLRSFADIESGFRPGARTGSYKGLFQLSGTEFKRGGGKGSIFNPVENAKAFANIWKDGAKQFQKIMGRPPQGWETYLVHQQGVAGGPAHLKNPDQPAWKSMHSTPEGRKKGPGWSKKAIWGNIPKAQKKQFGKVENVTSGQFSGLWKARYARAGGGDPGADAAFDPSASSTPLPERGMRVAGRGSDADMPERRPQSLGVDQNVVMVGGGENPPPVPSRRNEMAGDSPQTPNRRPVKFDYRAPEYQSANDIGAGGPPSPERNPQDAPEAPRSALIPGTPEAGRSGSRLADPVGSGGGGGVGGDGFDPMAQRAFGGSFGELYGRPDQGSTLLKDVLPSGRPNMGGHGVPPRPPMFRDFFNNVFGFGGGG